MEVVLKFSTPRCQWSSFVLPKFPQFYSPNSSTIPSTPSSRYSRSIHSMIHHGVHDYSYYHMSSRKSSRVKRGSSLGVAIHSIQSLGNFCYMHMTKRHSGTHNSSYTSRVTSLLPHSSSPQSSLVNLFPLLQAQPPFYIRLYIHGQPFLLTEGDRLRLPFRIPGLQPGDILRLNCATLIGSRDFTLRAGAHMKGEKRKYIDESLYVCRAVVLGVESEPLRIKLKTKQRQRRVKHIKSKHRYTILTIRELTVNSPEKSKLTAEAHV